MDLDLTAEQQAFLDEVRRFADDEVAPRAAAIDESDAFPRDLVARAGALGLMGVTIPEAWGGARPGLRRLHAGDRDRRRGPAPRSR